MALPREHFGYAFVGTTSGRVLEKVNIAHLYSMQSEEVRNANGSNRSHNSIVTMLLFNSLYDSVDLSDKVIEFSEKGNLLTGKTVDAYDVKLYFATDSENPHLKGLYDLKGDISKDLKIRTNHYYEVPFITIDDLTETDNYKPIIKKADLYDPFKGILNVGQRISEITFVDLGLNKSEAEALGLEDIYSLKECYEKLENYKELGLNASQVKDIIQYMAYVIIKNEQIYNNEFIDSFKEAYFNYSKTISDAQRPITKEHSVAINGFMNGLIKAKKTVLKSLESSRANEYEKLVDSITHYLENFFRRITRYYDDNELNSVDNNKKTRLKGIIARYSSLMRNGSISIDSLNPEYAIVLSKFIDDYNKIFREANDKEKGIQKIR